MSNARQYILAGLIAALSGQVDAAQPCPKGTLSATAATLSAYAPAQAYCTANYPLTTTTLSSTAPTQTIVSTVRTITTSIPGVDATVTSTAAPVTSTTTSTRSTTILDPLNTITLVFTPTTTQTVFTATVTVTSVTTEVRGAQRREAEATPEPLVRRQAQGNAALLRSVQALPTTGQKIVCRCLEVRPRTTVVFTPRTTLSLTSTVTAGSTTTTLTITPTVTSTSNVVNTITTTSTSIRTALTEVTTTLSTALTRTALITIPSDGPDCLANGDYTTPGTGGCSIGCLCDLRKSDGTGFCNNGLIPAQNANGVTCNTDADCAVGATCASDSSLTNPAGTCVDFTGCLTTYNSTTGTFPAKGPVANLRTFPKKAAKANRKSSKKQT